MDNSKVLGAAELQARLRVLPSSMVKNILSKAVREAANIVKDQAKANFASAVSALGGGPSDTSNPHLVSGALMASIRTVARRGTPTRVVFNVVAGKFNAKQKDTFGAESAYYAMWVEKGHINRKLGDALRGSRQFKAYQRATSMANTPAHPFLAPALEAHKADIINKISESISSQLGQL